jgi:protein tyrosine/serine phosphatase
MHRAAVVLALTLALPVATQELSLAAAPKSAAVSSIRIDNFGKINDRYYRGAQPSGRDYADLAGLGIKTVIDLQQDGPRQEAGLVEQAGMRFHRIPMTTSVAPTAAQIATFLEIVNNPENQPVYVHCAGGRHRTGVMTAIYRMNNEQWTSDRAFKEMKDYNFGADFLHPEFKRFVFGFQPATAAAAKAAAAAQQQ